MEHIAQLWFLAPCEAVKGVDGVVFLRVVRFCTEQSAVCVFSNKCFEFRMWHMLWVYSL